jgi:hypothetical protein
MSEVIRLVTGMGTNVKPGLCIGDTAWGACASPPDPHPAVGQGEREEDWGILNRIMHLALENIART